MKLEGWLRLRELFADAVLLEPEERERFLERACGDDAALRREVESLLAHDAGAIGAKDPIGEVVDAAAATVTKEEDDRSANMRIGRKLGNIKILERLDQGGMGAIYIGYDETLQRRVALKTVRSGHRLAAGARARFLREARMLSQLEHPNICRIHDFIEGDDDDFLVLELIEGKNLRARIHEGWERGRRMKVAMQIADALRAAHDKGIVHRDLKPQNVMVTPTGEAKVLDFGLARSAKSQRIATHDIEEADTHHTEHGQILGTPVYMSPEQAAGEPVTTASDMYSFGLLLQTLFTGDSPYPAGLEPMELLARARRGETRSPTGIDKDLVRLIERLKSAAKATRPNAVAALDDLRWIYEKPRRRLRQVGVAGAFLLIALGASKYTFDLKNARDEATARQNQAEGLLTFMLEDLRTSLEPLGRLDLLDAVGDRAMAYFAAAPSASLSDQELSKQAQALTQIGDVRVSQLRYDEALIAFEGAYARAAALCRREPENGERLFDRGQAEFWLGNIHFRRGTFAPARTWFERYLTSCESLLALDPQQDDWIREVAYGHHNLAVLALEDGDVDAAAVAFKEEVDLLGDLLERQPEDVILQEDLADAYSWLGAANQRRAALDAAGRALRKSSELFSELEARDPADLRWRFWGGLGKILESQVLAASGEAGRAYRLGAEGKSTLDLLVATDPDNRRWRRVRASARIDLAELLSFLGKEREAIEEVIASGSELGELLTVEPTDRKALQSRIRAWRVEAEIHLQQERIEAAEEALSRARTAARDALRGARSRDPIFLAQMAFALELDGRLQAVRGNRQQARRSWQAVLDLLDPESRTSPELNLLEPWIRSKILIGQEEQARTQLERLSAAGYRPLRPWPEVSFPLPESASETVTIP